MEIAALPTAPQSLPFQGVILSKDVLTAKFLVRRNTYNVFFANHFERRKIDLGRLLIDDDLELVAGERLGNRVLAEHILKVKLRVVNLSDTC